MDRLADFKPNEAETAAAAGFPEQVAIGYIRRSRRWMNGRRQYTNLVDMVDLLAKPDIFGSHQ